MQLEILKRDKLNYVFQSLSVISIAPVLLLEPIKNWSVSNFNFTESWYNGKAGMIVQILILIITFVSYLLTRKLKDNGSTNANTKNTENPWQQKIYSKKILKKIKLKITCCTVPDTGSFPSHTQRARLFYIPHSFGRRFFWQCYLAAGKTFQLHLSTQCFSNHFTQWNGTAHRTFLQKD